MGGTDSPAVWLWSLWAAPESTSRIAFQPCWSGSARRGDGVVRWVVDAMPVILPGRAPLQRQSPPSRPKQWYCPTQHRYDHGVKVRRGRRLSARHAAESALHRSALSRGYVNPSSPSSRWIEEKAGIEMAVLPRVSRPCLRALGRRYVCAQCLATKRLIRIEGAIFIAPVNDRFTFNQHRERLN